MRPPAPSVRITQTRGEGHLYSINIPHPSLLESNGHTLRIRNERGELNYTRPMQTVREIAYEEIPWGEGAA